MTGLPESIIWFDGQARMPFVPFVHQVTATADKEWVFVFLTMSLQQVRSEKIRH